MVGATGIVTIGNLQITVTPLTMTEERALRRVLLKSAEQAATDYYTRCARLLDAMRTNPLAYTAAINKIVELTATGPKVSDEQFYEFRTSPEGVRIELFHRGRKATQGLTLDGLSAIITEANVDDVIGQLDEIAESANPKAATP